MDYLITLNEQLVWHYGQWEILLMAPILIWMNRKNYQVLSVKQF